MKSVSLRKENSQPSVQGEKCLKWNAGQFAVSDGITATVGGLRRAGPMPRKPRTWPRVRNIALTLPEDLQNFVHAERVERGETASAWVLALIRREMLRAQLREKRNA